MPFDGIDSFDNHPLAKLGAVERLLATEQQWCKGRLRDAHGRHCLVGAIEAVDGRQMLQRTILQAARDVSGKRYWRIEFFNDDPRTTHEDVLRVLRHARENIIAGMLGDPAPWHRRWMRVLGGTRATAPGDGIGVELLARERGASHSAAERGMRGGSLYAAPGYAAPGYAAPGYAAGAKRETTNAQPAVLELQH